MAKYGFDEENEKYIPERWVQSEHIVAHKSELGQLISDYMNKTVTKILLAKNNALLNDRTHRLADELKMQNDADNTGEQLNENYLKNHIVCDENGNPITDEKTMSEWVNSTFHFALSDIDRENAWIFDDKKHDKKTIAITTKMLEFAQNSSQLEGIIAHELGHYFVSQRYTNPKPAINEKMADQHALDCLYYMGKNPDEYGIVFNRLHGIYQMSDADRILLGMADEHGSPTSRLQDIDNYNEACYGDYIEELDENEQTVAQITSDDEIFSTLKQTVNKFYANDCYIGTLETSLMKEETLKPFISEKTGRIDINKVPYEQVLDILLTNADDTHFCSTYTLEEAAYLLAHSSKDGLELNERINEKVNTILEKAGTSVLLNAYNYKDITLKKNLRDTNYQNMYSQYRETSLASVLIKEAQQKGETITAEQMADKIEQVLLENNLTITEKSQWITYNKQEFWLRKDDEAAIFLLLDKPQSPALAPEVAEKRGEILNQKNLNSLIEDLRKNIFINEQEQFINGFDKLCFAAAYPTLDLDTYLTEHQKLQNELQQDIKEKNFLNQVMSAPHLTIEPISTYNNIVKGWDYTIHPGEHQGSSYLSTHDANLLPLYSRLAMNLPSFELPAKDDAIGCKLPWTHLEQNQEFEKFGLTLDKHVISTEATANDFTLIKEFNHFKNIISLVKFANGTPYEFIADKNGKIIAVGDEVATLKQQKTSSDEQHKIDTISAHFSQNIKTLDAVMVVSILHRTSSTRPLNEKETQLMKNSLHYLVEAPNLEPHLLGQTMSPTYNHDDRKTTNNIKELNYKNMPDNSPQIDIDFEKIQKSVFYQQFFAKKDEKELSRAEKKERLIAVQNWQAQEKTANELQTIIPVITKIMEQREKHSSKENYRFAFMLENSEWRNGLSERLNRIPNTEKKDIVPLILNIQTPNIEKITNLQELHKQTGSYLQSLGTPSDELLYTKTKLPYYEEIRKKLNLPETQGKPYQLYANLTAKIENVDTVSPNQDEAIIQKLEDIKKRNETDERGRLWIAGYSKLNSNLTSNDHKLAEYEVMRYINEPSNPPLDCLELLKAFPKYGNTDYVTDIIPSCTDAFRQELGNYILEKSNFSKLDFHQQRKVYEQMLHKDLFDKKNANKFIFLEELKKSYLKLPEAEKAEAALSMLQDKTFTYNAISKRGENLNTSYDFYTYEKTETQTLADYPPIRNFFIAEYADRYAAKIGPDPIAGESKSDGTLITPEDIRQYQQKINTFINMINSTTTAAPEVKEALFDRVAEQIEAQAETAKRFEVGCKHITTDNDMSKKNELSLRLSSSINEYLTISPQNNTVVIDFLTTPYSPETAEKFKKEIYNNTLRDFPLIVASLSGEEPKPLDENAKAELKKGIYELSNEDLRITHADFWDKPLDDRSVLMQRLLENATFDNIDKSVDIVIDKYLKPEEPYYKEAKDVLKTLYKTGSGAGHYRKNKARFMLGAMLGAQEPTQENTSKNMGIGQALALFCSANGPAWVKFGQALSNIPNLPDDIRKPLSILKDRAVHKKRWELFKELEQNLPKEKLASIKKVGKILGAGSFFSSVSIELKDGSKHVLQMMSQDAPKKAKNEFRKIIRSIKDLTKIDKMYKVLDKIVERADESTKTEVNINKGYEQYVEAAKNYAMIDELNVNGVKFKLKLVPWTDKYQDENGNGFKQMEYADGKSLNRLDCSPEEKKVLAAGYVATELGILLSGKAWDIDRHNGQQNFNITRDKNGKITDVEIGIFDTGALRPAPNEQDKTLIANFYAAVLKASIHGDDINNVMFKEVQNLEDKGINAAYVSDIQRGCIALSDLCEYQKEERDANGNITQPSLSFSQKDYISIFGAAVNSGLIDHKIIDPLLTKLVTDKKLITAVIRQKAQQKFDKIKNLFTDKSKAETQTNELHIIMSAKGCLATKEQNRQIDQSKANTLDNAYRTPTPAPVSKQEKHHHKLSRMLQAAYIKHSRRNK